MGIPQATNIDPSMFPEIHLPVNQTSGILSSLEGTVPSVPPMFDKLQMDQLLAMFAQHLSNADKNEDSHDNIFQMQIRTRTRMIVQVIHMSRVFVYPC